MRQAISGLKAEVMTFRVPSGLKADFIEIARDQSKPVGQLLREMMRSRVEQSHHQQFEAEARRQSKEAASAALVANSDEARVLREIDTELEEMDDRWS